MIEAQQLQVASSRGYHNAQTKGRAIKSIYPRNRPSVSIAAESITFEGKRRSLCCRMRHRQACLRNVSICNTLTATAVCPRTPHAPHNKKRETVKSFSFRTRSRDRTGTDITVHRILSPACLPIPPFEQHLL